MTNHTTAEWQPKNPARLAGQFSWLGWIGFWTQLVLIAIPIALLIYVLVVSSPESVQRKGINLGNYLSYGSLVVMAFTTFWLFRYTRVAKRIEDPELRPTQASVQRTLWVGLWAGFLGVFFSMLLMMSAVGRIFFVLMATPQTGVPLATVGGDPSSTLSAIDAVSLSALLLTLTAELMVLAFSLWLLFRVTRPTVEPEAAAE